MRSTTSSPLRGSLRISAADVGLGALVLAVAGLTLAPLSPRLLDLLFISNLAFAALLVIVARPLPRSVAWSALPAAVWIVTLCRLGLNLGAARLILQHADTGRAIREVGGFVVRPGYGVAVGALALGALIQLIVVSEASARISAVGARFASEALPGKQLAIEADVRASEISPDTARQRRAALQRESSFYVWLDGAMKFVKSDALAGVAIAVVCFAGGVSRGVFRGERWHDSAEVIGLATLGAALLALLPPLLVTAAARIVVKRVAEHERSRALSWNSRTHAVRGRMQLDLGSAPTPADRTRYAETMRRIAKRWSRRHGLPALTLGVAHDPALGAGEYTFRLREAPVLRGRANNPDAIVAAIEHDFAPLVTLRARELLDEADVQGKLDELATRALQLVRSVVPNVLSVGALTDMLHELLDEGVSLKNWPRILEAVYAASEHPAHERLARVRRALREQIVHDLQGESLGVHRLDPVIEDKVREAVVTRDDAQALALAPEPAREIVDAVRNTLGNEPASIVTQTDIRRFVYELLAPELPRVSVLSYDEIPPGAAVVQRDPIRV